MLLNPIIALRKTKIAILAFLSAIWFAHVSVYENLMQERSTNSPMIVDFHTGSGHENVKKSLMMYKITLCSWDFWAIFTTILSVFFPVT